MSGRWARSPAPEAASERILAAAAELFAEAGVGATGMGCIARRAGCSRGTLYRYFPDRETLWRAYVERSARRIGAELGLTPTPDAGLLRARLAQGVLAVLRAVRSDPGMSAWFDPAVAGDAVRLAQATHTIEALARNHLRRVLSVPDAEDAVDRAARWLVRVIVSFLVLPGADADEERHLLEAFALAAPVFDASDSTARAGAARRT